jgi:hypothetical protein
MASPALTMTNAEKRQRAALKRRTLVGFLASGEVYTTLSVAAELLQTSERNALRLLQTLVEERILKIDEKVVPGSNLKLYGITAHGLALTESAYPQAREFQIGKTNPGWVPHHIEGQKVRIRAEHAGWTGWIPGKLLLVDNEQRLKKLPDALCVRPDARRVAVEIERYVKSKKRMADVVAAHLQQIVAKRYDFVYYFSPHKSALERALDGVQFVIVDANKVKLNDSHRARFKVFDIQYWKGEM